MLMLLLNQPVSGGTVHTQTIDVTCTSSVTMSRAVGKNVAVSCAYAVTMSKAITKTVAISCSSLVSWIAQKAGQVGAFLRGMTVTINDLNGIAVQTYVRGSTVFFEVSTVDGSGNSVAPNGVTLYLVYNDLDLKRQVTNVSMTIADNQASYAWDSSVAADGVVRWSVKAVGGSTIVEDGTIQLTANDANPTP